MALATSRLLIHKGRDQSTDSFCTAGKLGKKMTRGGRREEGVKGVKEILSFVHSVSPDLKGKCVRMRVAMGKMRIKLQADSACI